MYNFAFNFWNVEISILNFHSRNHHRVCLYCCTCFKTHNRDSNIVVTKLVNFFCVDRVYRDIVALQLLYCFDFLECNIELFYFLVDLLYNCLDVLFSQLFFFVFIVQSNDNFDVFVYCKLRDEFDELSDNEKSTLEKQKDIEEEKCEREEICNDFMYNRDVFFNAFVISINFRRQLVDDFQNFNLSRLIFCLLQVVDNCMKSLFNIVTSMTLWQTFVFLLIWCRAHQALKTTRNIDKNSNKSIEHSIESS